MLIFTCVSTELSGAKQRGCLLSLSRSPRVLASCAQGGKGFVVAPIYDTMFSRAGMNTEYFVQEERRLILKDFVMTTHHFCVLKLERIMFQRQ